MDLFSITMFMFFSIAMGVAIGLTAKDIGKSFIVWFAISIVLTPFIAWGLLLICAIGNHGNHCVRNHESR